MSNNRVTIHVGLYKTVYLIKQNFNSWFIKNEVSFTNTKEVKIRWNDNRITSFIVIRNYLSGKLSFDVIRYIIRKKINKVDTIWIN